MKYFFGLFLIYVMIGCQTSDNDKSIQQDSDSIYLFKNKWDTINVIVKKIDSLKRVYIIGNQFILEDLSDTTLNRIKPIDTFEDIRGNKLHVRSIKADSLLLEFFCEINLKSPVKIEAFWLDSVEKYNNKPLPKRYLLKIFNPYNDSVAYSFSSQIINIDEDTIPEYILQFHYSFTYIIAIIDNVNGDWLCKSRIETNIHYTVPKLSIMNMQKKIIKFNYESGWGTGYFRNSTKLYRFINGKTYECLDYVVVEGDYYKFQSIWEVLNSDVTMKNCDTLKIEYTYDLYSEDDNGEPAVIILKGKKERVFYKWNDRKNKYEIYFASNKYLLDPNGVYAMAFGQFYKKEIDSIAEFGTSQQKQVLEER